MKERLSDHVLPDENNLLQLMIRTVCSSILLRFPFKWKDNISYCARIYAISEFDAYVEYSSAISSGLSAIQLVNRCPGSGVIFGNGSGSAMDRKHIREVNFRATPKWTLGHTSESEIVKLTCMGEISHYDVISFGFILPGYLSCDPAFWCNQIESVTVLSRTKTNYLQRGLNTLWVPTYVYPLKSGFMIFSIRMAIYVP